MSDPLAIFCDLPCLRGVQTLHCLRDAGGSRIGKYGRVALRQELP